MLDPFMRVNVGAGEEVVELGGAVVGLVAGDGGEPGAAAGEAGFFGVGAGAGGAGRGARWVGRVPACQRVMRRSRPGQSGDRVCGIRVTKG